MRLRPALVGLTVLALSAPVVAAAHGAPSRQPIGACDWSSFRNGPRNPGATTCTGIQPWDVPRLLPRFLYRTRDSVTSTPAVVDGVLYVGTWDGWFYAFDADDAGIGDPSLAALPVPQVAPLWETRVDDANSVSFGRIVSSPTVVDVADTRIVIFAGGATIYALDAADGRVLAQQCLDPREGGGCLGSGSTEIEVETSPVVVPEGPGSVAVVTGLDVHNASSIGRTGVVRLRLDRGDAGWAFTPQWKYDPESDLVMSGASALTEGSGTGGGCGGVWGTPAVDVAADLVVFGTASCSGSTAGPDGVPGSGDEAIRGEEVVAVRLSDGRPLWRHSPERPYGFHMDDDFGASAQLFELGDRLVAGIGGKDGWYYALDAATGSVVWASHLGQAGHLEEGFAVGGVLGSPAIGRAGPHQALFVTTAISTPFGAPLGSGSPEAIDASLLEDPLRMLSLHAIDAATGAVLWRQPLTRQTYGHPTYANGVVFVPSTAGLSVQAYDAATGLPIWTSLPLNGAPSSGVAVTADAVYFGAGTRQTDLGFKLTGDDSVLPPELAALVPGIVTELVGADPQERLSGVWAFAVVP